MDFSKQNTILLVGTNHSRYLYRFWNFPVGSQWIQYMKGQIEFVEGLGPELFPRLIYRPGIINHGWNFKSRVKHFFPELKIDNLKVPFEKIFRRSRLVVIDHNATCFLETLAANHPTLIFFDLRLFEIRDAALEFFDALKSAGIFFDTPAEAAEQALAVYHDVERWWFSAKLQECRRRFVEHFALTSPDSEKVFAEKLLEAID